jgi:hypothetical protein
LLLPCDLCVRPRRDGPRRAATRPLCLARAHVRTCHHFRMQAFPRCAALLRDGRACERTVVEGSEFCVHHDRLLADHGADALKQGLPQRKQARGHWQPTIIAVNANESAVSSEGSASNDRRSADPATVRPRLAAAAAENVDDIRRTLLDAATAASKPAWVEFECTDCGNRKRVEVPVPDVRARVAAIELLLREGLGRPAQAEEPPTAPRIPETKAEIEALGWEALKALALAYPEAECLPEERRRPWLSERWVSLTQADRDAFRAVLDAADATRAAHSVV